MEPSTHSTAPLTTTPLSSSAPLVGLSDAELLTATRRLVGRANQLLASLLAHLAEVEARGLHRSRACASLYTYCIFELRYSEDEAFRRVSAARLVRRFPALLDAVASGELHLTGLLMLGPHLTAENLTEVLARSKHRTKKEIARLVRRLDPLPDVPARIEPLGPAPARSVPVTPTWSQFVELLSHSTERIPLDELQLRAMRAFVAELERKKRAATKRPAVARATQKAVEQTSAAQNPHTAPEAAAESNDNA